MVFYISLFKGKKWEVHKLIFDQRQKLNKWNSDTNDPIYKQQNYENKKVLLTKMADISIIDNDNHM